MRKPCSSTKLVLAPTDKPDMTMSPAVFYKKMQRCVDEDFGSPFVEVMQHNSTINGCRKPLLPFEVMDQLQSNSQGRSQRTCATTTGFNSALATHVTKAMAEHHEAVDRVLQL